MSSSSPYHGVVVPMSTPFTSSGAIDEAATERMVDRLSRHSTGVFVLGTTGETASLTSAQRTQLVTAAVRAAGGRVPVYAGIGDNCLNDSVEAGATFHRLGATAVVAHLPGYYTLNAAEMRAYFDLLIERIPGPILLYNIPQTTHMSLPTDVAEQLSQHPRVVGLKDSENVAGRPDDLAQRFAGRTDFALFMGVAALSARALQLGFRGLVPSSGNLIPELWRDLYQASVNGEWARVEALQIRANQVAQVFQRNRSLAQSLAALKAGLESLGLCSAHVLPPLQILSSDERVAIQRELSELNVT
jgi:dihydrodipicolinate synthase/N-acetylneuraminate lyase